MGAASINVIPNWRHLYLRDSEQLGDLFEYVAVFTEDDVSEYIIKFMHSPIRKCMDEWHPRYCNDANTWLYKESIKCMGEVKKIGSKSGYAPDEARWIGEAYGRLHYITGLSSVELMKHYPLEEMRYLYPCLHEVSWTNFLTKTVKGFTYADADKYLDPFYQEV